MINQCNRMCLLMFKCPWRLVFNGLRNSEPLVVVVEHLMLFQTNLHSKILPLGVDTFSVPSVDTSILGVDTSSLLSSVKAFCLRVSILVSTLPFPKICLCLHLVLILVSTLYFPKILLSLLTFGVDTWCQHFIF